ncbi:unnamed protein product [Clavelina lepadiformis]|uniref:EF-hand domain-containing protein n=2 Tax=Clavelina lepadiformis TaxID=159417 RepID=A0ABP0FPN8_CLALP
MSSPAGSEKDLLISNHLHKRYGDESGGVRLCSIVEENQDNRGQHKLSTFFGVIVPCCLSMFSVILFLRMGFIVGQAGMLESLAMVVLAYAIIGLTVLSVCAISTNGAIEGGGAYFMISRALGPEFGGAIGLMFFLANAASSALYIFGIVEALTSFFGENGIYEIGPSGIPSSYGWNYLYGTVILLLCLVVCVVGADIYAKTTFMIFLVVMVSIASVVVSFFAKKPFPVGGEGNLSLPNVSFCNNVSVIQYAGLNGKTVHENLYENYTIDYTNDIKQTFVTVFAVLFNGCTGIMAGANMSGDLKNPSKSIPLGTISACAITFFIYILLIVLITATTPRVLLQCDYSFLVSVNLWGPFVAIGVFASSLSAALSCLIGASRILFALARDDLFGIVLRPINRTTHSGNPLAAVLATWFLVQLMLLANKVSTIAPIVTVFFLFSYAATDLACLALEWASSPNFRPTFKYFTWHTCLLGFLSCITMNFLVNAVYTSVSIAVLIILLVAIHYRVPQSSWGYISQALIFHQVRKYLLMLDVRKEHIKFWRPQIVLMVKNPRTCCQLIDFINSIKKSGLYVLGHVRLGSLAEMPTDILSVHYQHWLNLVDELGVKAFVELTLARSVREGTEQLLRISGLGGMKPNTLVLGFNDNQARQDTFKLVGAFAPRKRTGSKLSAVLHSEKAEDENNVFSECDFFPPPNPDFDVDANGEISVDEYVSIISDALKLQKNVCLARYFDKLNKSVVMSDKSKVHYIDVWPVNFLKPLLSNDSFIQRSASDEQKPSSYFDTTCVFLMQLACILNMTPFWKKRTKLRIFLCVDRSHSNIVTPGDQELEEFLRTVRISAEIKQVELNDITESLSNENNLTIQVPSKPEEGQQGSNGDNLHATQTPVPQVEDKPLYLSRINNLIKSQLSSTAVTFLYLPAPPPRERYEEYLDMLTKLSDDLGPTLFVHGLYHVISTTL